MGLTMHQEFLSVMLKLFMHLLYIGYIVFLLILSKGAHLKKFKKPCVRATTFLDFSKKFRLDQWYWLIFFAKSSFYDISLHFWKLKIKPTQIFFMHDLLQSFFRSLQKPSYVTKYSTLRYCSSVVVPNLQSMDQMVLICIRNC